MSLHKNIDTKSVVQAVVRDGLTQTAAGARLGIVQSVVYWHLKKAGYVKGWYQVSDETVLSTYSQCGQDVNATAEKIGVASSYISSVVERYHRIT